MQKIITDGLEARKTLKKGVDAGANLIKPCLGNGRNIAVFNGKRTEIFKDGASVLRAIDDDDLEDDDLKAGVSLARQAADQTNIDAGDATTTTVVLLQAFLDAIITDFETSSPHDTRIELHKTAEKLINSIKPKVVKTREEMFNLAFTSSKNEIVAKILSDGFHKLGKDAKVVIEETNKETIESEIVDGLQFDSKIATDSLLKSKDDRVSVENVYVFVVDRLESGKQIQDKLNELGDEFNGKMVVISNYFERAPLLSMVGNTNIKFYAIENTELNSFEDIKEYGNKVMNVAISRETTTLIGGKVSKEYLDIVRKKTDTEYDKDMTEKRIARMTSGILKIKVGAKTPVKRNEISSKIEDAHISLKKALHFGYVPGAGDALLKASEKLSDEGVDGIIKRIAKIPNEQIKKNLSVATIPESVIDSFLSVKCSFLNALEYATSTLTVEGAIIKKREEL